MKFLVNKTLERIQKHYDIGKIDLWRILHTVTLSEEYQELLKRDVEFSKSQIAYDLERKIKEMLGNPALFLKSQNNTAIFSHD
jgi:hypothetical protein